MKAPAAATTTTAHSGGPSPATVSVATAITNDSLGTGGKKPSTQQHTRSTASAQGDAARSSSVLVRASHMPRP